MGAAAQLRYVTEITLPQPFLCVNRSLNRYDFRGGAKAIRYTVDSRLADTPPMRTRTSPPSETHKEMTEINSRYYGLSLLRKCGHFPAPKRDSSLVFFLLI